MPTRRDFVQRAALASAALALPGTADAEPTMAGDPSIEIALGCVGVGGMGASDLRGLAAIPGVRIAALCDVDANNLERAGALFPQAARYRDFREMLAKARGLDAVSVSTPDHSHAAAVLLALRAGKHVYCQKPLARTVGEVRAIMDEARRRPRQVTQMGNQGHANEGIRLMKEWVDAGVIGTVRTVEMWTDRPIWPQGIDRTTQMHHVPAHLDWDLWLGPAPERPFAPGYAHFNWRGWWDFGTGAMGDMACHIMDAAFWVLQLGIPTRVIPEGTPSPRESAPKSSRLTFEFPARGGRPAVTLVWRDGSLLPPAPAGWAAGRPWPFDSSGQAWVGDRGVLLAGTYAENPRLADDAQQAALMAGPPAKTLPRTGGVYQEWVAAMRAGTQPGSDFAGYAGPLTEMIALGNLAVRAGRTIELDPATGRVLTTGIPVEWITPVYRKGWTL